MRYGILLNLPRDRRGVRISELINDGTIAAWDGHGSPSSQEKGSGDVPYIRVSDIVNWELYRNPVSGVSQEVYERFTRNRSCPQAGDVIFVRRGSYRIGTVAMASPRDTNVLLTRELLTMRVQENIHGITPAYLLAMLSTDVVQDQIKDYVFYDTTMPTIGDRWKHLVLPIHRHRSDLDHTSSYVSAAINAKWDAQDQVDELCKRSAELRHRRHAMSTKKHGHRSSISTRYAIIDNFSSWTAVSAGRRSRLRKNEEICPALEKSISSRFYAGGRGRRGLDEVIHPPFDHIMIRTLKKKYPEFRDRLGGRTKGFSLKGIKHYSHYQQIIELFVSIAKQERCKLIEVGQYWNCCE